ncbi:MAG: hypothetical protein IBX56_00195 [Methylomicrobium sp.]|nr:hypothetical protein [Methylomicrobium sp.]
MQVVKTNSQDNQRPLVKTSVQQLNAQLPGLLERQENTASGFLTLTDHLFNDALSRFAGYVGPDGKPSSSPSGFKTRLNRLVKEAYGVDREHMGGMTRMHCGLLYAVLREILVDGMDARRNRGVIRDKVWETVRLFAAQWQTIQQQTGV